MRETPWFLHSLDVTVYSIPSESSPEDKRSLLRLQKLAHTLFGEYNYLEIGSDRGGSLLPLLLDNGCTKAISVDLRPASQPDERGVRFDYPVDGEEIMLRNLSAAVKPHELAKLTCYKCDIKDLRFDSIPKIRLALIDGEHTNIACFSDATNVLKVLGSDGILAFHDANLIVDAIINFRTMLEYLNIEHHIEFLPDCVAVMALRNSATHLRQLAKPISLDRDIFIAASKQNLLGAISSATFDSHQQQVSLTAKSTPRNDEQPPLRDRPVSFVDRVRSIGRSLRGK